MTSYFALLISRYSDDMFIQNMRDNPGYKPSMVRTDIEKLLPDTYSEFMKYAKINPIAKYDSEKLKSILTDSEDIMFVALPNGNNNNNDIELTWYKTPIISHIAEYTSIIPEVYTPINKQKYTIYNIDCSVDKSGRYCAIETDAPEQAIHDVLRALYAFDSLSDLNISDLVTELNNRGYHATTKFGHELAFANEASQPLIDAMEKAIESLLDKAHIDITKSYSRKLFDKCIHALHDELQKTRPVLNNDGHLDAEYVHDILSRVAQRTVDIIIPYKDYIRKSRMRAEFIHDVMDAVLYNDIISGSYINFNTEYKVKFTKDCRSEFIGQIIDLFENFMTSLSVQTTTTHTYIAGKDYENIADMIWTAIEKDGDVYRCETDSLVNNALAGFEIWLNENNYKEHITDAAFSCLKNKIIETIARWS